MNQSELEANTCNRCQAREKACGRGTIGFGFVSHWLKKRRDVLLANHRAKQSEAKVTGHFRVAVNLIMKARLCAKLFI